MGELVYPELAYKLNGIFYEVQNKLGTKFQEKHYLKAICSLLDTHGIIYQTEVPIKVEFNGIVIGNFRADLIVDNKILVELKVTDRLNSDHKMQLIRYLTSLNMRLALLINFRMRPLQVWRVVN